VVLRKFVSQISPMIAPATKALNVDFIVGERLTIARQLVFPVCLRKPDVVFQAMEAMQEICNVLIGRLGHFDDACNVFIRSFYAMLQTAIAAILAVVCTRV